MKLLVAQAREKDQVCSGESEFKNVASTYSTRPASQQFPCEIHFNLSSTCLNLLSSPRFKFKRYLNFIAWLIILGASEELNLNRNDKSTYGIFLPRALNSFPKYRSFTRRYKLYNVLYSFHRRTNTFTLFSFVRYFSKLKIKYTLIEDIEKLVS